MSTLRDDLGRELEEGLYLVVGMTALGLQRACARARTLAGAPLPARVAGVAESLFEPLLDPLREVAARARRGRAGAGG